jgi:hypothetical protein
MVDILSPTFCRPAAEHEMYFQACPEAVLWCLEGQLLGILCKTVKSVDQIFAALCNDPYCSVKKHFKLMVTSSLSDIPIDNPIRPRLRSYPSKIIAQLVVTVTPTTHIRHLGVFRKHRLLIQSRVEFSLRDRLYVERMEKVKVTGMTW